MATFYRCDRCNKELAYGEVDKVIVSINTCSKAVRDLCHACSDKILDLAQEQVRKRNDR